MYPYKIPYRVKVIGLLVWVPLLIFGASGCNMDLSSLSRSGALPVVQAEEPSSVAVRSIPFLGDYGEALEISVREAKPMLVFFTLSNCASSRRMLETTFCNEEIKRLSTRFVCVKIDGAHAGELCRAKNITSFPTILFQNSHEQELQRLSGSQSSDQLTLQMHVMLQSTAAKTGSVVRK